MSDPWVLIRSWHRIRGFSRSGQAGTLCGRWVRVQGTLADAVPGSAEVHPTSPFVRLGDKTCESCLRILAKSADA